MKIALFLVSAKVEYLAESIGEMMNGHSVLKHKDGMFFYSSTSQCHFSKLLDLCESEEIPMVAIDHSIYVLNNPGSHHLNFNEGKITIHNIVDL